jgi:glycerophosphoryl diester phosphodiesterase
MTHSLFANAVKFYNVAHRGFSAVAPENTISAFEKGIEAGADMLEIDVMLTGDGQVIVFHDYRLGRTTDGSGLVKNLPFNQIRTLDAGGWFSQKYRTERVPLLDEALELAKGRIFVNIEMKHRRHNGVFSLVDKCERIVERHRMTDEVLFSSFNLEALRYLHYKAPRLRFAPLYRHNLNPTPRSFPLQYNAQGVVLNHLLLNRTTVRQFHNFGIKVFVYTVNGLRKIEKMIKMGVDGVISDDPLVVGSVAKKMLGRAPDAKSVR